VRQSFKLAAAIVSLGLAASPAMAEQLCGAEIAQEGNMRVAMLGGLSAACEIDSICSVTLATGDDMRVDMERASLDGSWLIKFSGTSSIDTGAGVDLVFNGDDETRVAPEFLIASEDKKAVRVDDDVSQIMVTTMVESKTMMSTVQFIGGKKINMEADVSNLGKALEWVDCAQAKQ
jgi:azurin